MKLRLIFSIFFLCWLTLFLTCSYAEDLSEEETVAYLEDYTTAVEKKESEKISIIYTKLAEYPYLTIQTIFHLMKQNSPPIKPWKVIDFLPPLLKEIKDAKEAGNVFYTLMRWEESDFFWDFWEKNPTFRKGRDTRDRNFQGFMWYAEWGRTLSKEDALYNTVIDVFYSDGRIQEILDGWVKQFPEAMIPIILETFPYTDLSNNTGNRLSTFLLLKNKTLLMPHIEGAFDEEKDPIRRAQLFFMLQAVESPKLFTINSETVFTAEVRANKAFAGLYGGNNFSIMRYSLWEHQSFNQDIGYLYRDETDREVNQRNLLLEVARKAVNNIVKHYINIDPKKWSYEQGGPYIDNSPLVDDSTDTLNDDEGRHQILIEIHKFALLKNLNIDEHKLEQLINSSKYTKQDDEFIMASISFGILFLQSSKSIYSESSEDVSKINQKIIQAAQVIQQYQDKMIPPDDEDVWFEGLEGLSLAILAFKSILKMDILSEQDKKSYQKTYTFFVGLLVSFMSRIDEYETYNTRNTFFLAMRALTLLTIDYNQLTTFYSGEIALDKCIALLQGTFYPEDPLSVAYDTEHSYDRGLSNKNSSVARTPLVHLALHLYSLRHKKGALLKSTQSNLVLALENYIRFLTLLLKVVEEDPITHGNRAKDVGDHFFHASVFWVTSALQLIQSSPEKRHQNFSNKSVSELLTKIFSSLLTEDGLFKRIAPNSTDKRNDPFAVSDAYSNFTIGLALTSILALYQENREEKLNMTPMLPERF
ncbi:MAG: hypothetical protein HY559_03840 [Gammaproteobacteria bacterium]|nr:hypothetical protein [Gammaproteobacteria bacterium]